MSKLTKFINHPKWFYKDAFRKYEPIISYNIKKINSSFETIKLPIHINIDSIEQNFVNTAANVTHNRLTYQILKLIGNTLQAKDQQLVLSNFPKLLKEKTNLSKYFPHIIIKNSFEISINPPTLPVENTVEIISTVQEASEQNLNNDIKLLAIPESLSARAKNIHARIQTKSLASGVL